MDTNSTTANISGFSKFMHKIFGTQPNDGDIQPKEALSYGIAGFGQNLICTIIGSYITIFMTDAIGFPALNVALLMLFTRVFDAFNDPIMGSIVDYTRTKWGKCRPYLKWTPFPIAILTILCFLPWYPSNPAGFALISAVYVIWSVAYTIVDVPYWGLATAMTTDTVKRTNVLTVTRLLCTAGAGIVTILIPQITEPIVKTHGTAAAPLLANTYFIAAIVVSVIAIPMFLLGFKNTRERVINTEKPNTLGKNLRLLFKNTPLMLIVLSGVLGAAKMAYTYTGGLYFAKYVLADVQWMGMRGEGLYAIITLAAVPGGLVASLLVPFFQKKFGKRNTFIYSHLLGAACMAIVFAIGLSRKQYQYSDPLTLVFGLIGLVIIGIPMGFGNIISYAMIGDTVEYLELKTGERAEGICFAMQTFINKISMAVGAFIGVLGYHLARVTPNNPGALDAKGKDIMWIMLILLGAVSLFGTAIPLFFYKFTEARQKEAVAIISERKAIMEATGMTMAEVMETEDPEKTAHILSSWSFRRKKVVED